MLGPQHQGAGDGDALALAARELAAAGAGPSRAAGRRASSISCDALAARLGAADAAAPERHGDDVARRARGLSEENGILEHRLDQPRARLAGHVGDRAGPRPRSSPAVGGCRPRISRASVDLPQPELAHDAQHAALRTAKETSSTAMTCRSAPSSACRRDRSWPTPRDLDGRRQRAHRRARVQAPHRARSRAEAAQRTGVRPAPGSGTAPARRSRRRSGSASRKAQPSKPAPMRGTVPGIEPSGSPRRILPGTGTRAQQALRVGVARAGEQLARSRALDDLAGIHHATAVRDARRRCRDRG